MRVAIVNDLRLATEVHRRMLASGARLRAGLDRADGAEAVERCRTDLPDLVLMDLVMPVMDGVEATRRIMRATPCPILVVTATIEGNLARVYDALGAGALDAVATPTIGTDGSLVKGAEPVLRKLRTIRRLHAPRPPRRVTPVGAGRARRRAGARRADDPASARPTRRAGVPAEVPCVLLGSSTGGPEALSVVLRGMSKAFAPPIVVVQHLDPEFVPGLVEWLAHETGRRVRAILPRRSPRPAGTVHVARTRRPPRARAPTASSTTTVEPADQPYRPSVDVFFASVARRWCRPASPSVLTGMGRDGAAGLLRPARRPLGDVRPGPGHVGGVGMPRACAEKPAARARCCRSPRSAPHLEAAWRAAVGPRGARDERA